MDPQIKRMLIDSVDYKAYTGTDTYGDDSYADPVTLPCYWYGKVGQRKRAEGDELTSNLRLLFDGLLDLNVGDHFVFKGLEYEMHSYSHLIGALPGTGTTEVFL